MLKYMKMIIGKRCFNQLIINKKSPNREIWAFVFILKLFYLLIAGTIALRFSSS